MNGPIVSPYALVPRAKPSPPVAEVLPGTPRPIQVGTGGLVMGALSESSGWVIVDAVVGAGVGWAIAPEGQEKEYAVGGALATGFAGVLGLGAVIGYRYLFGSHGAEPERRGFAERR